MEEEQEKNRNNIPNNYNIFNFSEEAISRLESHSKNNIINYYQNFKNLNSILNSENNQFIEDFELVRYITTSNKGTLIYEGKTKNFNSYDQRIKSVGIKFYLNNKDHYIQNNNNWINKNNKQSESIIIRLRNKNIISILNEYKINNIFNCVVMDFPKYGNIKSFVEKFFDKKYLSETILLYFAKQMLTCLKYFHQAKISLVHNFCLSKIFVDENFNIKISNISSFNYKNYFFYRNYNENQKIKVPLLIKKETGAPLSFLYTPPEVLSEKEIFVKDINKLDVFTFGVILYNLAYQEFPYQIQNKDESHKDIILNKIKIGYVNFPNVKTHSLTFRTFLRKLLNKNIKNRFSIKEVMEEPWIKGAEVINKEKEKIDSKEKFFVSMITDNIRMFNEYIKKQKSESLTTCSTTNSTGNFK